MAILSAHQLEADKTIFQVGCPPRTKAKVATKAVQPKNEKGKPKEKEEKAD